MSIYMSILYVHDVIDTSFQSIGMSDTRIVDHPMDNYANDISG